MLAADVSSLHTHLTGDAKTSEFFSLRSHSLALRHPPLILKRLQGLKIIKAVYFDCCCRSGVFGVEGLAGLNVKGGDCGCWACSCS